MDNIVFQAVSAMDRIKGAQDHFGKGLTGGKMIIIGMVVAAVIAFIIFGIVQARKK